jgi:hypothetical protein
VPLGGALGCSWGALASIGGVLKWATAIGDLHAGDVKRRSARLCMKTKIPTAGDDLRALVSSEVVPLNGPLPLGFALEAC